jgi:hypothetical protein
MKELYSRVVVGEELVRMALFEGEERWRELARWQ